jgi:hypothetical protein
MMKYGSLQLSIVLAIVAAAFLKPESLLAVELTSKEDSQIHAKLGSGYGYESNVFYSTNDPKSDSFVLTEAMLNASLQPGSQSFFFVDFSGSYQHFLKFNEADRIFADLILDYHYFITPSVGFGLSNTLSYADLKLFDTEGNTLPRNKFSSISERARLYGFYYPSHSLDLELGGSYRLMNMAETAGMESLDFQKFAGDFSLRYIFTTSLSSRLRYEYSLTYYDEFQALNRDSSFTGTSDSNNPTLRLERNDVSLNLWYERNAKFNLEITGRILFNHDLFEDELNYRQSEVRGSATLRSRIATSYVEFYYMERDFSNRTNDIGSNEKLKETYFIGTVDVSRSLKNWLEVYARYQWIHYTTNAPALSFNDHIALLGLRLVH